MPITTLAERSRLAVPDEAMLVLADQAQELERRLGAIFDSIAGIADLGSDDELALCRELFDMKEGRPRSSS